MINDNSGLIQQNELIANQNKILRQMNELMLQQNQLLQRQLELLAAKPESFVENIDRDEMRSGFLVTSHRKKLWNVQIGLVNEVARICKKHNIHWFAYGGTLLGAVRHKGFIPWDDDVDLAMLRPDYEKFRKVAPEELKYPYFFDPWYNYKFESEGASESVNDNLQLVKLGQEQKIYNRKVAWPCWPQLKIRDCRTSQIMWMERKHVNQGIFIDIFPLDPVPPFDKKVYANTFEVTKELFMATNYPRIIKKSLENNQRTLISRGELEKFLQLPFKQRALNFDKFTLKNFHESKYVGQIRRHCLGKSIAYETDACKNTVYLPFEKITIPVLGDWEFSLTSQYGDWRKMSVKNPHALEYSANISYTEYYKNSALMR